MKQQILRLNYQPRQEQLLVHEQFFKYKKRFTVCVAFRRMGKTTLGVQHLIGAALSNNKPAPRYGFISTSYTQAKRNVFDMLVDFTRPLGAVVNIQELRVDFMGRRIALFGSENVDALRGMRFDGIVIDEVADQPMKKLWSEVLRPTLSDRAPDSFALMIGTPRGQNHFKDFRDKAAVDEDWSLLEFKASDSNVISKEELAQAKKEMGLAKFEQEYMCSFAAPISGSYYAELLFEAEEEKRIGKVNKDNLTRTYVSWDLGISDSTSIWVCQAIGMERRIIDFYENNGKGLEHYVHWIKDNGYDDATMILPSDIKVREFTSGRSRLEIMQSLGLDCEVLPKMSLADGIQQVRKMLPHCYFDKEKTIEGIELLKSYRREYDERRNVFNDRPVHDFASHAADSFRYLASGIQEQKSEWTKKLEVNTTWIV